MARLAGVNIPDNKQVETALTYIYGVGLTTSGIILTKLGIEKTTRVKDLSEAQINEIRKELGEYLIEADLRRKVSLDIKRLIEVGCYRGIRHRLGMPVRGQRTKCNARTRKGPSKAVAGKKG